MSLLDLFSKPKGIVGIELGERQISMVSRNVSSSISAVSVMEAQSERPSLDDWAGLMSQFVEKHQLQKFACNVVMSVKDYQLMLVERPDVPDDELREAVKWRVKDLISAPIESVVIDIFALPDDASKAGKRMVYVVIGDLAKVQGIIDATSQAGLALQHIDIEVLALRNLTLLKDPKRATAVVRLRSGAGDVSIYRDGNLYLSRHFNLAFSGGLLEDLPTDALALEVQRSFDYFERQMGQVPPSILYICGEGIGPEKITETLQRSLPCPVEFFDVTDEIGLNRDSTDEALLQLSVAAIGAAYRGEAA